MVEVTHRLKASATAVSLCESSIRAYTHFYAIKLFIENERVREIHSERERERVGVGEGGRERLAFG